MAAAAAPLAALWVTVAVQFHSALAAELAPLVDPVATPRSVTAAAPPVLSPPSGQLRPVGLPVPYGYQVAISGDTAAVSGRFRGVPAVWVFARNGGEWSVQARIISPDAQQAAGFGNVMALSGDVLAVSGGSAAGEAAAVYVYVRSGTAWTPAATLEPPAAAGPGFGQALALAGDTLAVGAPGDAGAPAGSAAIYTRSSGFALQAVLAAESPATQRFGQAVAVAHQAVMVGAPGLVEVFENQGGAWSRVVVLEGGGTGNTFGQALAASNETLAIGDPANQRVSLYIHAGGSWVHQQDVVAPDLAPAAFGGALALSQGALVVGAPGAPGADAAAAAATATAGTVYTYARVHRSWLLRGAFAPAGGQAGSGFGGVVAVSHHTAVAGSLAAGPGTATAWLLDGLYDD